MQNDANQYMNYYELDFFGLKRKLPLTYISRTKRIANFNILGDVEFTEKAGEEMEKKLREKHLIPDCFVGPGTHIVSFVHHMAKRFHQNRYVLLRKGIRGYMTSPMVEEPWRYAPKHARKLVVNGSDREFLKGKKVILVDDVVSTGATMSIFSNLMRKLGVEVIAKIALFRQGDQYQGDLIYLKQLPIVEDSKKADNDPVDRTKDAV